MCIHSNKQNTNQTRPNLNLKVDCALNYSPILMFPAMHIWIRSNFNAGLDISLLKIIERRGAAVIIKILNR